MKKYSTAYKAAVTGLLGAVAVGLSYLEGLIPPIAFLPPGAKLGLSNVAVMFAAAGGVWQALTVALIKSVFVLITRGTVAFFMSFAGGVLSALAAALIMKMKNNPLGWVGLGVACAVIHNIGQLAAAWLIMGSRAVTAYAPFLLLFGVAAGCVTGILLKTVMPLIDRPEEKT